jgi:hypothetical protein
MAKNTVVFGMYPDATAISEASGALRHVGFRATDIAVLSAENHGSKDFAHEQHSKAGDGAAVGAAVGALLFAPAGVLAALGILAAPLALQTYLPPSPVVAGLAAAGLGGALGWVGGLIAGLRRSRYIAKRYVGRIRRGGILLSVHCDSLEWRDRAMKTLKDSGGRNLSSASEGGADYGASDRPTERLQRAGTQERMDAQVLAVTPTPVVVEPLAAVDAVRVSRFVGETRESDGMRSGDRVSAVGHKGEKDTQ